METMHEEVMALTAWQLVALVGAMAGWYAAADLHLFQQPQMLLDLPLAQALPQLGTALGDATASTAVNEAASMSAGNVVGGGGGGIFGSGWSVKEAAEVTWMGFVTTAGVLWGETAVMKSVSAAEAGIIFSTEPLWATAFASFLLSEALHGEQVAGAGLILLGCLLSVVTPGDDDGAPAH